MKESYRKRIKP